MTQSKATLQFMLIAMMSLSSIALAQQAADSQTWFGTIKAGGAKLRVKFVVTPDADGQMTGEMYSLDQGDEAIALDNVTIKDGKVEITVKKVGGSFQGDLNEIGDQIKGTWAQSGLKLPLTLEKVDEVPAEPDPSSVWLGTLQAGPSKLRLQFRVFEKDDGQHEVLLDSLTQGVRGIESSLELDGDKVTVNVPSIRATFKGTINEDQTKVSGNWEQAGRKFPLELAKVDAAITKFDPPERPQHPKPPLPYREKSVAIENETSQATLVGTLTLPKEPGKYPAVVLISGSGPQDRDESLLGHKPFLVIADHLTRQGIAVLRFDDRGTGESTGDFATATTKDFASDVYHIVKFLKTTDEIDSMRIGLIGHSEGGLIAPMVAAAMPDDIAHIVLLAGPGIDGGEIITSQSRAISEITGEEPEKVEESVELLSAVVAAIRDDASSDEITSLVNKLASQDTSDGDEAEDADMTMLMKAGVQQMTTPWFRYFIKLDPLAALRKVACPVLALNGDKDLQVLVDLNLPVIEKTLKESGNEDYRCVKLDGLNHLFQASETGSPMEYQTISETFSPRALDLMSEWVLAH